jgi:hypothetical protein
VREAGVPFSAPVEQDPFVAWSELMDVVEALCPQWPPRPPARYDAGFRL